METSEQREIGPQPVPGPDHAAPEPDDTPTEPNPVRVGLREGHANGKALVALVLGLFAMVNVTAFAVLLVLDTGLDDAGAWWMLMPFFALLAGSVAAFLGSIAWIDVRRGITDRRLLEAKLGTVLGAIAAGMIVLALIVLFVIFILLVIAFGSAGGGVD